MLINANRGNNLISKKSPYMIICHNNRKKCQTRLIYVDVRNWRNILHLLRCDRKYFCPADKIILQLKKSVVNMTSLKVGGRDVC